MDFISFSAESIQQKMDFSIIIKNENSDEIKPISLSSDIAFVKTAAVLKETDNVFFMLRTSYDVDNIKLWIQDVFISYSIKKNVDNGYEYLWKNLETPFFLNHFGHCQITLNLEKDQRMISFFCTVEILAKITNAQNAEKILHYLEFKLDDISRTCFSLTHHKSGEKKGRKSHFSIKIQKTKNILSVVEQLLPQFRSKPFTRVREDLKLIAFSSLSSISENDINRIAEGSTDIYPANVSSYRNFRIKNKHYSLYNITAESLVNHTDIYENQVIHLFLNEIHQFLRNLYFDLYKILNKIGDIEEPENIPIGYQSLASIQKQFGKKYYEKSIESCSELIKICERCQQYLCKYLPVSERHPGTPEMTMGFRLQHHYRKIFELIQKWNQYGSHTIIGDYYLLSLRTLDKLFEFYCLYRIVDAIHDLGYSLYRTYNLPKAETFNKNIFSVNPASQYYFRNSSNKRLTLYYNTIVSSSVNQGEVFDILTVKKGSHSLQPDFLLRIHKSDGVNFGILDAKYTNESLAKERYLSEITMKYFHGLALKNGGINPVNSLHILYPNNRDFSEKYTSFHYEK
ncbi:MAG: hypothetical protein HQK65_12860, partial [Desulfamplus sp.]|nr:hypothetical protein [Desulfamplus sp.]